MRCAVYFNHYNTLGHSTRVLGLIRAIRRYIPNSQIVIFESGKTPSVLPLKQYARVYPVPYSIGQKGLAIEENMGLYGAMITSPRMQNMLLTRQAFMFKILKKFQPDVFITEHFPLGKEFWTFELPPLLERINKELPCKIVGSVGYLNAMDTTHAHVKAYYDRILVHAPKVFALKHVRKIPQPMAHNLACVLRDFKKQVVFTGFLLDKPKPGAGGPSLYPKGNFKKNIFVSRGGGIVCDEILVAAIQAAERHKDWFFLICCGPATSVKDLAAYERMAQGLTNVRVIRALAVKDFDRAMADADVCVSMGGYNTVLKLMYFQKRAVVVPFYTDEQRWRAELVLEYLPAVVVPDKEVSAGKLSWAMTKALFAPRPRKKIPAAWFDGGTVTARELQCL
ncbi:MAG: hypothetical protein HQL19_01425 [Candidatus Omnitrophica bacterium]|nr:hypothetical protein [Candidatus Omnitrophota bacterium]